MALDQKKYEHKHETMLRDIRPLWVRICDKMSQRDPSMLVFLTAGFGIFFTGWGLAFADLILAFTLLFWLWLSAQDKSLAFKLPKDAPFMDANNGRGGKPGKPDGILYLGNVEKTNEEVWFTNSDARTHILYLGTTGAGKTEGLKSIVSNALAWGSGFVYVDGKADTDLWSSLSALVRRFGRDDDLLVLNYMTGNSDVAAPSNTMNPFSSGSASYLTNMLVSLMPESGGDNAMWKERAVSLISALMPALTYKRDHQDIPMSVRTIRDYVALPNVIKLSRDEAVPDEIKSGLKGYLETLPGFIEDAYDNNGKPKPPGPDTPQYDTNTASQQHGYLAMQFTRALQSLGDDYGYIFDTQAADVDMVDVVLNRRILVVLVPALEKSGDEVANLGKIVAASIKGMMGSALGATVEGEAATVIENKPSVSSTPFITVFDEVGYYVAEGMAVMAAQARSLGFCLVFSGQDLPALKKRVREEANSITANCNIKLFGKLEDPTETKEFFEKTVGSALVTEVSGYQMAGGSEFGSYHDTQQASIQQRPRASYEELRGFVEGEAIITFGEAVVNCGVFYSNPGHAKAMRVTRFVSLPPPDEALIKHSDAMAKLRDLMVNKTWTAMRSDVAVETPPEIDALNEGFDMAQPKAENIADAGIAALIAVHGVENDIPDAPPAAADTTEKAPAAPAQPASATPPRQDPPLTATTPEKPADQPPAAATEKKLPESLMPKPLENPVEEAQNQTQNQQSASPPPQAKAEPASGNPMGFFGAKKPATDTNQEQPSETKAPAPPTEVKADKTQDEAQKPKIFGNTPATPSQETAKAPEQTTPKSDPVQQAPDQQQPEPAQNKPVKTEKSLPPEILNIIENAAKDAKKAIFKDDENIDAAE